MTAVCEIFKSFGEERMEEHFNIRQMLTTLKIPDWKHIPPFAHYLQPLEDALQAVRDELMMMHKRGALMIRYYVEENAHLKKLTVDMLKADKKAQLLMGDSLKQDQFRFFFDTCNVIYDSALINDLYNKKEKVIQDVIPKLMVYRAVLHIRDIQLHKKADALAEKEKLERKGTIVKEEEKDVT